MRLRAILVAIALCAIATGTAAAQQPLRVCADPDYLPFSNKAGQGFENKIAQTTAALLGTKVAYTWETMRGPGGFDQFLNDTLQKRRCDLVVDVPYAMGGVTTTRPYYISSYVFLYKKSKGYDITSMDSPLLHRVKIGYEADTPAEGGLKMRALTPGALPFEVGDNPGESSAVIVNAIDSGRINVGITWEPAIGYYLRGHPEIAVVTVPNTRSQGSPEQYSFPMAMGLRTDEGALRDRLNKVLESHRSELQSILREYGVRFFQPENSV